MGWKCPASDSLTAVSALSCIREVAQDPWDLHPAPSKGRSHSLTKPEVWSQLSREGSAQEPNKSKVSVCRWVGKEQRHRCCQKETHRAVPRGGTKGSGTCYSGRKGKYSCNPRGARELSSGRAPCEEQERGEGIPCSPSSGANREQKQEMDTSWKISGPRPGQSSRSLQNKLHGVKSTSQILRMVENGGTGALEGQKLNLEGCQGVTRTQEAKKNPQLRLDRG